jgi:hypothetical protein
MEVARKDGITEKTHDGAGIQRVEAQNLPLKTENQGRFQAKKHFRR